MIYDITICQYHCWTVVMFDFITVSLYRFLTISLFDNITIWRYLCCIVYHYLAISLFETFVRYLFCAISLFGLKHYSSVEQIGLLVAIIFRQYHYLTIPLLDDNCLTFSHLVYITIWGYHFLTIPMLNSISIFSDFTIWLQDDHFSSKFHS